MKKYILMIALTAAMAAGAQAQRGQQLVTTESAEQVMQFQKLAEFYRYLTDFYVDTLEYSHVVETAIVDILSELDPHSAYVSIEEMKASNESFGGSFSGIGIEFNVLHDTLMVVNTVVGGPSEKVGLLPNDKIVEVDGESIVGVTQARVPQLLRGPKGTAVSIGVVRKGVPGMLSFRIVRDNIPLTTVDAAYKVDEGTGYIKVNRFAQTTMNELREAVDRMGRLDALVLDLRGNGGGLMDQAIEMSSYFLKRGSVVMSMGGLHTPTREFRAPYNGEFISGRVVVLVDEYSASASEIVSGAIQDWDRGVIVGRRTFGKGLVQSQFPLIDGSAVRITTARYYTPTGRAIQRPFEAGDSEEYYRTYVERITSHADSLARDEAQEYKTLRLGRTVYGGGGIWPDIYVARDTTGYSDYYAELVRQGVRGEFVMDYMDRNRATLEAAYPDFGSFAAGFTVTDDIVGEMTALGISKGVAVDQSELALSLPLIRIHLKAMIAQLLWGTTEYYRVINSGNDPEFRRAVELLRNWKTESAGIVAGS